MSETPTPETEAELRKLMADKRYWRDHDPEIVRIVSEGFRKLHSGEALAAVIAERDALRAEIETMRTQTFDFSDDYFKEAIGGPYKPAKYGKHTAVNVHTIRSAMATAKEKAPELGDVIASLVFFNCINAEREKWLVKDANERAEAELAEARKGLETLRDRTNEADRARQHAERELAEARALLRQWSADYSGNEDADTKLLCARTVAALAKEQPR